MASSRDQGTPSGSSGADRDDIASPDREGYGYGNGLTDDAVRDASLQATRAEQGDAATEDSGVENPVASPKKSPLSDFDPLAPYRGAVRRFFTVYRHVLGLLAGGHIAYVRALPDIQKKGLRSAGKRTLAWFLRLFTKAEIVNRPFPKQLRRRLEILGPHSSSWGRFWPFARTCCRPSSPTSWIA